MEDSLNELRADKGIPSIITVAGIGGGGGNAVDYMYEQGITGVNFMICNTDKQALNRSRIKRKIVMGDGLGAGNDPKVGRAKAIDALDAIRESFNSLGTKMLFLTAGMGGGTGTGASPAIAKLAREMDILTVAIVTTPFSFEGPKRIKQAAAGIEELSKYVDSILIIENDTIAKIYGNLSANDAFSKADETLTLAAKGIAELIMIPGKHNVDFADVRNVLLNSGRVHMSVARAKGVNRIEELITRALNSPLMERPITGARDAIINISSSSFDNSFTLEQTTQVLKAIHDAAGPVNGGDGINIIWGTTEKPELGEEVEMMLVATNFEETHSRNDKGIVVLGTRRNRYVDIDTIKNTPAFQRRNYNIIVNVSGYSSDTELMQETTRETDKRKSDSTLFDNGEH